MSNIRSVLSMLEYANGCWYAVCPLCGRKFCFNDQYRAFIKQLRLINHPCEGEPIPEPIPPIPPAIRYHISVSYNELEDCSANAYPVSVSESENSTLIITAPNNVEWTISISNALIETLSGTGNAELEITEIVDNANINILFAEVVSGYVIRYVATEEASGGWVETNTNTNRNTWNSETNEGILFLNDGVNTIGGGDNINYSPFFNNQNIISVDLSDSNIENIGSYAFFGCLNMTGNLAFPDSVTSIGNVAYSGCSSLISITISENILSIGVSPFPGCTSVTSIVVDSNNPNYDSRNNCNAIIETSTNKLISGCINTIIPNNIQGIARSAFYRIGFTSIIIPNSVTNIEFNAFYGCSNLESVDIGNGITNIAGQTFINCTALTTVYCRATTVPTLGNINFQSVANDTLYVPSNKVYAYRSATNWSTSFGTITAIPNN